jgi:hypothetical protein
MNIYTAGDGAKAQGGCRDRGARIAFRLDARKASEARVQPLGRCSAALARAPRSDGFDRKLVGLTMKKWVTRSTLSPVVFV